MAKTANEELYDAMVRHQIYLLRFSSKLSLDLLGLLKGSEKEMFDILQRELPFGSRMVSMKDWQKTTSAIRAAVKPRLGTWNQCFEMLEESGKELAITEANFHAQALQAAAPVVLTLNIPSSNLLEAIATHNPFEGAVLREWVENMSSNDIRRIANAVQQGMVNGESMERIITRVRGTGAALGRDGAIAATNAQAQAVVRTAVQSIANAARDTFLDDNADIITEEQFVATLDSRTTPVCRANDGKRFPLGKGPRPPLHFGCRSLRIAYIDGVSLSNRPAKASTEKMLLSEYGQSKGYGKITERDQLPRGTKGAYDEWKRRRIRELTGQVPAEETYQSWLKKQSAAFQDDVLGKAKAQLFRNGGLPLDRFVNRAGDELTLKELVKKERQAFIDAGLDPDKFG